MGKIKNKKPPKKPTNKHLHQQNAQKIFDEFKPSILDLIFKRKQKKLDILKQNIEIAVKTDNLEYQKLLKNMLKIWKNIMNKWSLIQKF